MASLSAIRDGLKTNLETISGLRAYDVFPDKVNPPFAAVLPGSPAFTREAMARGVIRYKFRILVGVSRASDRAAQDNLDAYLAMTGAESVWLAIESDRTLAGDASDVAVQECTNYGVLDWNGVVYTGAEFEIEVLA
jgi:hypothetical protein